MSRLAAKLAWNCYLDDPEKIFEHWTPLLWICAWLHVVLRLRKAQLLDLVRFWRLCCGSMVLVTRDKVLGSEIQQVLHFWDGPTEIVTSTSSTLTQGQQAKVVVFFLHMNRIDSLSNPRLGASNSSASLVTESTAVASCQLSNKKRTPGCSFRVYRALSYTVKLFSWVMLLGILPW